MIKNLNCAYVPVSDAVKSAEWYAQVLGMKLRAPVEPGRGAIMIMDEGQWLFLLPSPDGKPLTFSTTAWAENGESFEMFPICFTTTRMQSLYASLRESGTWVETDIRDEGSCGLQLTFKDPDGNKFQVFQEPAS
ncbi:VOC family protein [Paenibacillus harenae]|uniref:VOC family protein n=1 Tax=Paenibacillus harenae TaxID=306543 RepID=UPI000428181D|nr:VOC family protein [Paenibacillus harenae]